MNDEYLIATFSTDEKAMAFDLIADSFYKRNFGTTSKTDLDCLLFAILLKHCREHHRDFGDYYLSKQLGVTQSRIRSLKQKSALRYPSIIDNLDWQREFVQCIKDAKYDDVSKLVKVCVRDVNVLIEIRHFLEEQGGYDEYQLNPKLFQCRLDLFLLLCQSLDGGQQHFDKEQTAKLTALKKTLKKDSAKDGLQQIISGDLKGGLSKFVLNAAKEGICMLLQLLPFGGIAGDALKLLIEVINK